MHANRKSKGVHGKNHRRGVVGIESAIVLIAFVIVAAALSFVVLNMGFSTTQKAKSSITSGLTESSSALEISGQVTAMGDTTDGKLDAVAFPIKVAAGAGSVDLDTAKTSIKYYSKTISYDDIYTGIATNTTYTNLDAALTRADNEGWIDVKPGTGSGTNSTVSFIYFTNNQNNDDLIDLGEQAVVVIVFQEAGTDERPADLDHMTMEVVGPSGSALTVARNVPSVNTAVLNLG